MIGFLIFGIPSAIIANIKGFKYLRWLLALGFIGLIVVICMKSANEPNIDLEEKERRIAHANEVGAWLFWANIALSVVLGIIMLATGA